MSKPRKFDLGNLIGDVGKTVAAEVGTTPAAPIAAPEPPTAVVEPEVIEAEQAIEPAPVVAATEVVTIRQAKPRAEAPAKPTKATRLRDRTKQVTLYLEEPVYEQLREIAHVDRTKMHQLIVDGIDLLLKKKGSPSISALMKKAG